MEERKENQSSTIPEEEYDPHLYREVHRPTNNVESLFHLIKASIGTGILAMPQAFAKAGLLTGVVGTTLTGILITYCLHTIIKTTYVLCQRQRVPYLTYEEAVKSAFTTGPDILKPTAKVATGAVNIFLVTYQLGICCVYIVFIAETLKALVDGTVKISLTVWMLIILPPLIGINLIGSLKKLAPLSMIANALIFLGLLVVVYYVLTMDKLDGDIQMFGSIVEVPLFLGTVLFALTAVGVVVAIEANMKYPKAFGKRYGVLNLAMSIIVFVYVLIGVLGYQFCRAHCRDSITLNLPQNALAIGVKILFAIAIFISYALHCYVPVEICWNVYLLPRLKKKQFSEGKINVCDYLCRAGLCVLTFIFAISIPRLGLFISLFGALCLSVLGVCYPAIMDICIRHPGGSRPKLIRDILIFIFGLFSLFIGSASAITAIINSF